MVYFEVKTSSRVEVSSAVECMVPSISIPTLFITGGSGHATTYTIDAFSVVDNRKLMLIYACLGLHILSGVLPD